ncbi:uncharacterized protein LOC106642389 [Copidosoma floridanum]|uniref:uncharacterized protein LOC106642389 n=1 Tax=Copidosoma floridanum TaxID=29053 RepID=UPI000C6F96AB|nr:uncharacterized protein LOC106642389 [Copidosoma floridanum]
MSVMCTTDKQAAASQNDYPPVGGGVRSAHCSSEPRLTDNDVSPGLSRHKPGRRGQSVYHGHTHRKVNAYLDVPDVQAPEQQQRADEDDDLYRLRSFSLTSKGVINRGDSFRRKRSRSNSLALAEGDHHTANVNTGGHGGSAATSVADENHKNAPPKDVTSYNVALLGSRGVGKSALVSQFMSSEGINAYDHVRQKDAPSEQSVFVMLNGEESELRFIDVTNIKCSCINQVCSGLLDYWIIGLALVYENSGGCGGIGKMILVYNITHMHKANEKNIFSLRHFPYAPSEQSVFVMLNGEESELRFIDVTNIKELDKMVPQPCAYVVMYSVIDKASFQRAEDLLTKLHQMESDIRGRPVIVVGNKIDLVRTRVVSSQDGRCLACTYRAKFKEISVGINHNIDDLLVGILSQIRLKVNQHQSQAASSGSTDSEHWYKSRGVVRASMKARQMLTWLFGKEDRKFRNCENLHVL